ncbi:MAG: NAD-dependent malic enzyme [Gemmatimonadetes bacterium]|nr:NAD-dependent malic enzyme [Gemmatimonadota bacterium]
MPPCSWSSRVSCWRSTSTPSCAGPASIGIGFTAIDATGPCAARGPLGREGSVLAKEDRKKSKAKVEIPSGVEILFDPRWNKGTAFTERERDVLGIRGLLPPRIFDQSEQEQRILENFDRKGSDLDRYIFMVGLQDRNQTAFYRTVIDNIETMLPIIYTPTVGEACQKFARIFRRPRGLYLTAQDRGRVADVLRNWPQPEAGVIVVTDGERILGLGDLGANGMGIPIGKLVLYTACAGIPPNRCLPVMLDVGTNNDALRDDPLYLGSNQPRLRGQEYDDLVEEFMVAVEEVFPGALIQFEDFATANAVPLLEKYRGRFCTFNDDIQGTAAVTLAGLLSAARITGRALKDQTIVFLGAGSAATGIGHLMVSALMQDGAAEAEALAGIWFVDSKGLVVEVRDDLAEHKKPFAHDHEPLPNLLATVKAIRPTTLIGVSGQAGTFTEPVLREMASLNERPVVLALSNPTSKAECTAEQAYEWTAGRAVFASGSPFDPVEYDGKTLVSGQGNNAYIFPGVGLGVMASAARHVTDEMFLAAAWVLAELVPTESLASGSIYPPLTSIRDVSAAIAAEVARVAGRQGLAATEVPEDALGFVKGLMYDARYEEYA